MKGQRLICEGLRRIQVEEFELPRPGPDEILVQNHYTAISGLSMAGGGLRHGQVIGASERDGGHIKERPVTPGDLAATIYRHMNVPLDATYLDPRGRPRYVVEEGEPIAELF